MTTVCPSISRSHSPLTFSETSQSPKERSRGPSTSPTRTSPFGSEALQHDAQGGTTAPLQAATGLTPPAHALPPVAPPQSVSTAAAARQAPSSVAELEDFFVKDKVTHAEFVHPVLCNDGYTYDLLDLFNHNITRSRYTGAALSICGPDRGRRHWSHHRCEEGAAREKAYKQFLTRMRQAVAACPRGPMFKDIDVQLQQTPYNISLRLQRAEARLAQKQYELAEQDFARVLLLAPGAPRALTGRRSCLTGMGQSLEVVAQLNPLLQTVPSTGLFFERGLIHFQLNRYAEATADLNQVVAAQDSNWQAHQALAWIHHKLNNPSKALYHADRVFVQQPNNAIANLVRAAVSMAQCHVPPSLWIRYFQERLQKCVAHLPAQSEQLAEVYYLLTKCWLQQAITQEGRRNIIYCSDQATAMNRLRHQCLNLAGHKSLHYLNSIVWSVSHAQQTLINLRDLPLQEAGVSVDEFNRFLSRCRTFPF
jgi:tetratricopeptide (TPR) repeat protein